MAGYITIGILLYVLLSRRLSRKSRSEQPEKPKVKPRPEAMSRKIVDRGEFVDLPESKDEIPLKVIESNQPLRVAVLNDPAPATRRENRRVIYQEARKLLAQGHSRRDLLSRLPLTETELEMLSAAGQA